ncbi:MAG: peptidylprolyl isomerase, partial [Elusimicrobia bacterium]|nr:peptidylprolyl isomerase [Elusimicrobiota bacterium]
SAWRSSMRSSSKVLISGVLAAATGLLPALGAAAVLEDVVARVNGKPLLLSEYKKNLRSVLDNYTKAMPDLTRDDSAMKDLRKKVLDQMVDDEVLAQAAEKEGLKVHDREVEKGIQEVEERSFRTDSDTGERRSDKDMDAALKKELDGEGLTWEQFQDRIRRQLMIRKAVETALQPKLKEADDARLKAAFERLKTVVNGSTETLKGMPDDEATAWGAFAMRLKDATSERVRVSHILVKVDQGASMTDKAKALEKAKELKKKLDAGADFYELAKDESDDKESAPRGGDLGWILRGWMPPAFEKAAFSLPVGQDSDPIETDFGYHIIRVQEKKAKDSLNFEKLKPQLKEFIYNLDYQKQLTAYVKSLREKATIEENLPAE